ncbi:MAG: PQQ-binding-like beta-propeller repeat protein [Acidobacteriaceae bacterium]
MTWTTANASGVTIDNGIGGQAANGNVSVKPTATTIYNLTATSASGATAATAVTVTVTGPPPPAMPTVQFSANPSTIIRGNPATLTWATTNATGFSIDNGVGGQPVNGSVQVSPGATTTYTATATGPGGTSTGQASVTVTPAPSGSAVLMHHNDLAGDGANLNETILTPTNVNAATFGRKYALPVDGQIYAQPLYVPGVMMNGTAHNTVFVATQNDSVYAFDADNGSQLWQMSLGTAVSNDDPEGVQPILGILSTPVIDANSNTMYVTAVTTGRTLKLHALDITTGAEKSGGPVTVTASVAGTGDGSVNGMVPLSKGCYQRTALTLANGRVYLGFGHCNHGWVLAYDAGTLAQTQAFNTTPNGKGGSIWMGDAGPVVDSDGNLYVISADDVDTTAPDSKDFPDAFLKLTADLGVLDSFIPSNERWLAANDADLGSGAPILMPDNGSAHPHEVIGGGKDGRVFVVDRDTGNMGGYHPDPNGQNDNVQTVQTGTQQFDNIWGAPAFFNGLIYFHTENDVLKAYSWNAQGNAGMISSRAVASGATNYRQHGASPSISANGTSNGIVWDVDNSGYPDNGGSGGTPAVLHAYDASDVSKELYNSKQAPNGRDTAGHACKFSVPTVTDGKVFVPTCTELDIYGLLP